MIGISALFKSKEIFQENHVPSRILFREDQFKQIDLMLKDLEGGVRPRNLLGVGDMATGKTLVFKHAYARLPATSYVYVNCNQDKTQRNILTQILTGIGIPAKSGHPTTYYWSELKKHQKLKQPLIVTLDEVDNFVEHRDSGYNEFFYNISREIDNIVITLLTNRLDFESRFLTALDPRARDTFRFEKIEFPAYNVAELEGILADRCNEGLWPQAYEYGTVKLIAALAFKEGLRARGMLDLARKAAEVAESNKEIKIRDEHVKMAFKHLDHDRDSQIIRRLHPVQLGILRHVLARVKITTRSLFKDGYSKIATEYDVGGSYTRFWDFLNPLINMRLIVEDKIGRGRGRGVEAVLTVPPHARDLIQRTIEAIQQENRTPTLPRNL